MNLLAGIRVGSAPKLAAAMAGTTNEWGCDLCDLPPFRSSRALNIHIGHSHRSDPLVKKVCPICKESKALAEFRPDGRRSSGVVWACRPCEQAYARAFYHRHGNANVLRQRASRAADPTRARAVHQMWRYANQEHHARRSRDYWLRKTYGISLEEFEALEREQQGRCAICDLIPAKRLHVDHDHATGSRRALLCGNCNRLLGLAGDNAFVLRRAIEYLNTHRRVRES